MEKDKQILFEFKDNIFKFFFQQRENLNNCYFSITQWTAKHGQEFTGSKLTENTIKIIKKT